MRFTLSLLLLFVSCLNTETKDIKSLCDYYDLKQGVEVPNVQTEGEKYVIDVTSDEVFRILNSSILDAIGRGEKNVVIRFKPGVYHFHQNHIDLRKLFIPETSITIEGNGARIIPCGKEYREAERCGVVCWSEYSGNFSTESVFISDKGEIVDVWTPIRQTFCIDEIDDNHEAKVQTVFNGRIFDNSCVRIPHWYYSASYPVKRIFKDGAIIIGPEKIKGFDVDYRGRNILNYECRTAGGQLRYQCFNVENKEVPYSDGKTLFFPSKYSKLYDCEAGHFILMASTTIKQFNVTGLRCIGARGDGHYINFSKVTAQKISFSNCLFKGLKSTVLMINQTHNVSFVNNVVERCYTDCVCSKSGSNNTIVANNTFKGNGMNLSQHRCIYCQGENYHIFDNRISDFAYAAIYVGVHYKGKKIGKSKGIIENNEVFYTPDFFKNHWMYTLSDGGAIYITSNNDEVIIRGNYIHDYIGINGNRAIFGDDGAKNVVIYGNVIKHVPNYYAIDLYRVEDVDKNMPDANSGNYVFGNYIDGAYRIGGGDNETCADGGNILVSNKYNRYNAIKISCSQTIVDNVECISKLSDAKKRYSKRFVPTYMRIKKYL